MAAAAESVKAERESLPPAGRSRSSPAPPPLYPSACFSVLEKREKLSLARALAVAFFLPAVIGSSPVVVEWGGVGWGGMGWDGMGWDEMGCDVKSWDGM